MSNNSRKNVIVVTGGIGSGKSTVCDLFKRLGAIVISADVLAREATDIAKAGIQKEFPQVFNESGDLNRKLLAQIVFQDPDKRLRLEALLHPVIQSLANKKFSEASNNSSALVIYECPLFFEAQMNKRDYRALVVVDAPIDISSARAALRDNTTIESIAPRILAQTNREQRNSVADYLIDNSGDKKNLENQVLSIFNKLVEQNSTIS